MPRYDIIVCDREPLPVPGAVKLHTVVVARALAMYVCLRMARRRCVALCLGLRCEENKGIETERLRQATFFSLSAAVIAQPLVLAINNRGCLCLYLLL